MTVRHGTAALLALSLVIGCLPKQVERDVSSLPEVPDRYAAERQGQATLSPVDTESPWWSAFDDPRLDSVLLRTLEENRDVAAAAARVLQARADVGVARSDLLPELSAGLSANRSRSVFIGFPFGPGGEIPSATATRLDLGVTVAWELDLTGRLRAGTRAAVANLEASGADFEALRLSLTGQAARTWFAIEEARLQADLSRRSADSFAQVAERIRERYRRGVRPSIELRLALSNAENAEASYHARTQQLDAAVRRLEVLTGRYPSAALLTELGEPRGLALPAPVPAGLPADLIGRRPDLIAAERRLAATEWRLLQSKRARYPGFSLTASGGTASDRLEDLLDGDFGVWSVVGSLLQPVFQGGRIRATIRRSEAASSEALAAYASAALQAYAEVETTLAAEVLLRRQLEALDASAQQLVAARVLAGERYRTGVGTYLELLEAQTRAFQAESAALTTRRLLLDNRVDLHLALGGTLPLPSNAPDPTNANATSPSDRATSPRVAAR